MPETELDIIEEILLEPEDDIVSAPLLAAETFVDENIEEFPEEVEQVEEPEFFPEEEFLESEKDDTYIVMGVSPDALPDSEGETVLGDEVINIDGVNYSPAVTLSPEEIDNGTNISAEPETEPETQVYGTELLSEDVQIIGVVLSEEDKQTYFESLLNEQTYRDSVLLDLESLESITQNQETLLDSFEKCLENQEQLIALNTAIVQNQKELYRASITQNTFVVMTFLVVAFALGGMIARHFWGMIAK